ncbi:gluconate 2-dehydrogenase subunit 3 family protein [Leptobacterium flavescens]|uniref:Gluconate 2-dehydrogenase subunit 3 family protein n=1 Tax=Leptobacterium flavescens TaxID=472055 RepID=A0A6P0UUD4_9FLAO|nr:gluconate 2-dehydrogenase subunit 3 family protein [Leptobacterium flavescens]NER14423.1 gluconate 2-dehydrogenase subunit 3 family protein [Leptobacterium flavescens]
MDRRKAIKNLGLSMGFVVATPTVLSILQSCQNEKYPAWTPQFFSEGEGRTVQQLVDIILPVTDTPGGIEVNVPQFVDTFAFEVFEPEQQVLMKKGLEVFTAKALSASEKEDASKLKAEDIEAVLAGSLKVSKEEQEAIYEKLGEYIQAMEAGEDASIDDDTLTFVFLDNIRSLAIFGYKTNEIVGKEVLAYDPVPGRQEGCVDLNETTQGKAWSL